MKAKQIIGMIITIVGALLLIYGAIEYYRLSNVSITGRPVIEHGLFGTGVSTHTAREIEEQRTSRLYYIYAGIGTVLLGVIIWFFPKVIVVKLKN